MLGDRVDQIAMAAGYDVADWLHIADRHEHVTTRGRVEIKAYPLRQVLADVQAAVRGPQTCRESLRRVVRAAAELAGHEPSTSIPRWLGFGPVEDGRYGQAERRGVVRGFRADREAGPRAR